MKALLLVDLQNDFMPGGALAVPEGNQIIPIINNLLKLKFDYVVASKDWHPENHGSFAVMHGKQPGEVIDLFGLDQILWPVHCVQGTPGAEFAPELNISKIDKVFYKGIDTNIDSYSAFYDNGHKRTTGLAAYLREMGIQQLFVAGLATEYCVKYSVLDATTMGFEVYVIEDGCKAINLQNEDEKKAFQLMKSFGAHLIFSKELPL